MFLYSSEKLVIEIASMQNSLETTALSAMQFHNKNQVDLYPKSLIYL